MAGNNKIKFDVGFNVDKSGLESLQSDLQIISNKVKDMSPDELTNGLKKAGQTAEQLDQILSKTFNSDLGTLNVTKFNQELQKSGLTLQTAKKNLLEFGRDGATAYNKLGRAILETNVQLQRSNKFLDSMATTMINTVKWGVTSSIFNSITNSIQKAYSYVKQLDTSLNDIRIVTDKSADEMDVFAEKANKAAKALSASTLDYTNASLIYYQQGLSDAEVAARAETTVKVANVTGQTGDAVSEQLTAVWNGYKVSAQETEIYVDKLAAVAASTAADLEELSKGMSKVASAANAMGVDFDDLNAQIATIVSVTRQAPESVGTALKTIYARLGDLKVDGVDEFGVKLGEVSSQMRTMGIEILDANGDMRDMSSVMAEVAEKWDTWTRAQQQAAAVAMAGKRQYNNLVALFENWDMYSDALETSKDSLGTLQKQQDIYTESTAAKLKELKATWQGLYQNLLKSDDINKAIEGLTTIADLLTKIVQSFGGGIKSITAFGTIFANIFNKQISKAIIDATQKFDVYKNNLDLIKLKQAAIEEGKANNPAAVNTIGYQKNAANYQAQLAAAEQIQKVSGGFTTPEEGQMALQYQQTLGSIAEEMAGIEFSANRLLEKNDVFKQQLSNIAVEAKVENAEFNNIEDILKLNVTEQDNINNIIAQRTRSIREIKADLQAQNTLVLKQVDSHNQLKNIYRNIKNEVGKISGEEAEQIKNAYAQVASASDFETKLSAIKNLHEVINNIIQSRSKDLQTNIDINKQIGANWEQIVQWIKQYNQEEEKAKNAQQELNLLLQNASKSLSIQNIVSSFSNMASSITMLMGAWNSFQSALSDDESLTMADRWKYLLTGIAMVGPAILQVGNALRSLISIGTAAQNLIDVSIAKRKVMSALRSDEVKSIIREASATTANATATGIEEKAYKKVVKTIHEKTGAEEADIRALLKSMGISSANIGAITAEDGAHKKSIPTLWAKVAAQLGLNAATLAYVAIAAVVAATVLGSLYAIGKAKEARVEERQAVLDNAKAINEEAKEKQKEIQANIDLINSYQSLYNKYKEGATTKSEMASKSQELKEYLDEESLAVVELTGNYDYLNKKLEETKQANLDAQINEQNIAMQNAMNDINTAFGTSYTTIEELENSEAFKNAQEAILSGKATEVTKTGYATYQSYKNAYEQAEWTKDVYQFKSDINKNYNPTDYNNYDEFLDQYNELLEKSKNYYEEGVGLSYSALGYSSHEDMLSSLMGDLGTDKNYLNRLKATEGVVNETLEKSGENVAKKLQEELNKLSDVDFNKVITHLEVDQLVSEKNVENAIKLAQQEINQEDLSIVTSLRAKISSDKKLTKTELKEALGEQEILTSEYDVAFADWDNESQIDQVEILNDIVRDKIKLQQEYVENIKEIAKEEKKIEEERKRTFLEANENELETLRNKKKASEVSGSGVIFTAEEQKRLEELEKSLDNIEQKIEYWNEVSIEGLALEDLNEITFDNLISGIDGLISETQVLADLVGKVGENWTIATKDIQEFAQNFPEVLSEQENFNYLQDGSIQLTEAGKAALQESLQTYEEKIRLENEAYQEELQRQADIQIATAEMYEAQAAALSDYLDNHHDEKKLEADLEQNYQNYLSSLREKTGMEEAELNSYIRQTSSETKDEIIKNQDNIFDGYVSVGEVAAKAAMAFSTGEFNATEVTKPSGKQAGGSNYKPVSSYSSTVKDIGAFKGYSDQDLAVMRDDLLKKAAAARNQAAIYESKKLGAGAQYNAMVAGMDNALSGKGNGKSSSSKSKDKDTKSFDEEFDRYWEFKKAIDMLDKSMQRLQKTQAKLHGKELIKSLEKENQLLEKQKANYDAILRAQENEAGELQGKLIYYGGAFADNGELANYAEVTTNMLNQYSQAVQAYNAGAITEAEYTIYEKQYEDFKKALERYDTLYYSEMQDSLDKIDDARRKQLENNLKSFETEIQIKLDLTEAERNWNDFIEKLTQDFRKVYEDLTIVSDFNVSDFDSYVEDFNTTLGAIKTVQNEIDKLSSTGKSDMFEAMSEAQEKLKELNEQLLENGNQLQQIYNDVWDTYVDGLDQTAEKLKDINDEFGQLSNELDHERKLIELIYGDKAYKLMDKYYKAQQKNINLQIDSLKTQRDFWEEQFQAAYMMNKDEHNVVLNDMSTWTEDMRKAYDEMISSQNDLNKMIEEGIQNLQDEYLNQLAEAFDNLEKSVWGLSLDELGDDWDRLTGLADEYLDDVEGIYEIQELANEIDKGINDTDNLKYQQQLQAFRDKEIKFLREKENLTQDDVDLVEARYNIMLKEMALEDAQNAKNSMKLTRNTSGNWTYQYVSDEEDVADKQQDLLQSYQNLYKMADDAYQHAMELATSTYQEMQDKMREVAEDTTLAEEEKMIKIQEIYDTYLPSIEAAVENSELYRQEAIYATGATFAEVCDQDLTAYESLTEQQQELVDMIRDRHLENYEQVRDALILDYDDIGKKAEQTFLDTNLNSATTAADIIHQWASDDGESVKTQINAAIDSIDDNTKEYEKELEHMEEVANTEFRDVRTAIEQTEKRLIDMTDKTDELTQQSSEYIDRLRKYLEKLEPAWKGVISQIKIAHDEMVNYKKATSAAIDEMNRLAIIAQHYGGLDFGSSLTGDGPGFKKTPPDGTPTATPAYKLVSDPYGASGTIGLQYATGDKKGQYKQITKDDISNIVKEKTNGAYDSYIKAINDRENSSKYAVAIGAAIADKFGVSIDDIDFSNFLQFATGGYTGDWGADHGGLAILHQKELVLNENDTSNFLRGINILRDMSSINGSIENSILQSIANMASVFKPSLGRFGSIQNGAEDMSGNVFNITAEFPNANDVTSIREAILSLPNLASQYIHQTV